LGKAYTYLRMLVSSLLASLTSAQLEIALTPPYPQTNPNYFLGKLPLGTPAQSLSLLFDTGSSDIVILARTIDIPGGFDQFRSQTFNQGTVVGSVQYGEGSLIRGPLSVDAANKNQSLEFVLGLECTFGGVPCSARTNLPAAFGGWVGLGEAPSQAGEPHFMKQMGLVNLLSVWYSSSLPTAILTLGFADYNRFATKPPVYVPVVGGRVTLSRVILEQPDKQIELPTGLYLVDSGNVGILLNGIPGVDISVAYDCSDFDSLPNLTISPVSSFQIVLTPKDYVVRQSVRSCFSLLSADSDRPPFFVLGVSFLRKVYTIFDRDQERLGFSPSVQS